MADEPEPGARRAVVAVAAGLVGALIGLAGAIVYRHAERPFEILLPWGLLLTLATAFAVTIAAARLARGPGALGVPIGWVVALLWLQQGRPEGDSVFAMSDFLDIAYLYGGMLTMTVAVVRGMTTPMQESPRP